MDKSYLNMPQINLVGKKGAFIDTFLHWALTTGRLIIIITESIALSVFVMRFSLDAQIVNLHDEIKKKQVIVNVLKHNENTYRNLQDRLLFADTLNNQSQEQTKLFFSLLDTIPDTIQLNNFNFTQNKLHLDINSNSTANITQCIQNLKAKKNISGISIDHIENRISSGIIDVTITANIKPE